MYGLVSCIMGFGYEAKRFKPSTLVISFLFLISHQNLNTNAVIFEFGGDMLIKEALTK